MLNHNLEYGKVIKKRVDVRGVAVSGHPAVSERAANMSRDTETCHVIHSFSTTRCDLTPRRSGHGARAGTGEALAVPLISDILTS